MKKPSVVHPWLFAIFPVLFLFSHNIKQISFSEILLPTATILAFTFFLLLLSRLLLKGSHKAGIVVSIFLIFFFSYGHVHALVGGWQIGGFIIGRNLYLLPVWSILSAWGVYFIIKTRKQLHNLTKILNVVAASLILISLSNIVSYKFKARFSWQEIKGKQDIEAELVPSRKDVFPDIYYIILDRYASNRTLKEAYDFDNSEFIDYLTNRGFYVAPQSNSNYLITAHSLASSLNMEFINYLGEKLGRDSDNTVPLFAKIADHMLWRFLKLRGYKYIHFGSFFQMTRRNKYADMNVNLFLVSEFSGILFRSTAAWPVSYRLGIYDSRKRQRKRILYQLDKLAEIPKIKEPTFVFAHMNIPHPPYVFDKNGNFVTEEEANKRGIKVNYINQLIFVNRKVKELVNKILSTSEVPPIIILQGDEGPCPIESERDWLVFNWKQATDAELRTKMGILNAYYLPNADQNTLYPSITPVNSFRLIFNSYFNTKLVLLPDESYIFEDFSHPYRFFRITDRLR